jgi:hypothetical protein
MDDILIIFDSNYTNTEMILNDFNSLHPKLQFMAETEKDHTLNYLDIPIHRTSTNMRTAIFRKPTFTDTIIPFTSNHPMHHKYATVRYLYNRLDPYNLQHEEYQQELNIIHNNLHNNSFLIRPHKPQTHNPVKQITPCTTQKLASFTYVGKETTYITNIFKQSELKIAFHTTYTLGNMFIHKDHAPDRFSSSGVYKLICPDCHKAYVGQT